MSEPGRESSTEVQRPKVLIVSSGEERELLCDYEDVMYMFIGDNDLAETLNMLSYSEADIIVYLSKDYDLLEENSVSRIVEQLSSPEFDGIAGVYTDISININGKKSILKPYPTSKANFINSSSTANIPFAVKQENCPQFSGNYKILFLHEGLEYLCSRGLIFHLPFSCFAINNFEESGPDIHKELKLLNG